MGDLGRFRDGPGARGGRVDPAAQDQEHHDRERPGHDQHGERGPERTGEGGNPGHQQRAGDGARLVQGLVHLTQDRVVSVATVPLVYAAAMGAEALAALATGWAYDRVGGRVLLVLPLLVALVPPLAFTGSALVAVVGVLLWGAANGLQDSTVKALVADLVPRGRRATAYGVFAAVQGGAAVAGGALAGALYERSLPALVVVVGATQVVALVLLVTTLRKTVPRASAPDYTGES
ncbi:Major Facilitator Superfamily protein [Microlunatus sagamiharensis]|uniref:Major Facilitator Superfamily protein n=1 Tax=Microlunatus sagamiharensis TaxID=546874 RepID=A0A1H2MB32_9ACTN|nr:MFS transporter [Microlunatus sagamiharensis]SDU90389.1 Major Facilitator Superfamily protein [Microlunatus sagamiharensis]